MRSNISSEWLNYTASMAGIVFSTVIIFFLIVNLAGLSYYHQSVLAAFATSPKDLSVNQPIEQVKNNDAAESIKLAVPRRLQIPKIKVDAVIDPVGLTSQGAIDTPKNISHVAWFNLGPLPGEIGNSVITGHYGWKDNQPSAFNGLWKLRLGDKLYISDDQGVVTSFVVRATRRYDPKTDVSAVFVSSDGKSHLNLITCEGSWNLFQQGYPKRLVVFADKE